MNAADIADFHTVQMFCAAADAQSFTAAAAAAALGTTPSAISKAVRRLENRLGVKLFQRTTRAIRLTDDGILYHGTSRGALDSIQQMEHALSPGVPTNWPRTTVSVS